MKYLFKATFSDGHIILQTNQDVSSLIPPDENGNGPSAFYDVLHYSGDGELDSFSLLSDTSLTKAFVHLKTGEIFVDGQLQTFEKQVPLETKKELVYWRVMELAHYNATPELKSFQVGWKATLDGKEIQHVVTVD